MSARSTLHYSLLATRYPLGVFDDVDVRVVVEVEGEDLPILLADGQAVEPQLVAAAVRKPASRLLLLVFQDGAGVGGPPGVMPRRDLLDHPHPRARAKPVTQRRQPLLELRLLGRRLAGGMIASMGHGADHSRAGDSMTARAASSRQQLRQRRLQPA